MYMIANDLDLAGSERTGDMGLRSRIQALYRWPYGLEALLHSVLVNAGVPQELRMKLTGHSSAEMNPKLGADRAGSRSPSPSGALV
jgi:hypothetical protein